MDALNTLIVSLAGSPWVLAVVLLVVTVDGFFPPIPSESVVVALAAIGFATGLPNPWLVLLAAAAGSFLGDNIAFLVGRSVGISRFRVLHGRRIAALMGRARTNLDRRPGAVVLTARFVPVGRVVVNVLAGASSFPRRRFIGLTAISGAAWAGYSVFIGVVAGTWTHDNPLLGVVVAIVMALAVGLIGDRFSMLHRSCSHSPRHARRSTPMPQPLPSRTRMTS